MRTLLPRAALGVLLFATLGASCKPNREGDGGGFDLDRFAGTYTGSRAVIFEDGRTERTAPITVGIVGGPEAGSVLITLDGEPARFRARYTTDEGIRITYGEGGSDLRVDVEPDGEVEGGGTARLYGLHFATDVDGHFTDDSLLVDAGLDVLEGNDEYRTGTTATFRLRLRKVR